MTKTTVETKWYRYRQNNSGGSFREPAIEVLIEALSVSHANDRAEREAGLYFDGSGDCSCCGNRWHEAYDEGADECPEMVYGSMCNHAGVPSGMAYPLTGEPREIPKNPNRDY